MRATLILVIGTMSGWSAHAVDLETLYRAALKRNESVQRSEARTSIEEGKRDAVESEYYPTLSASYSLLRQTELPDPLARSIFPAEQQTAKLSTQVNLYNGGATARRKDAASRRIEASRHAAEAQRIALYKDLARSYFSLAATKQEKRLVTEQIGLQKSFRDKLADGRASGRIRSSAILSIDASLLSREAELVRLEQRTREFWAKLLSESGLASGPDEVDAESELSKLPREAVLSTLESWSSRVAEGPEIRALSSEEQAAELENQSAFSGYLPRLDVSANYFIQRPPGIAQDLRWDVGLTLSVPLFDGFKTSSIRRTAESEHRSAVLRKAQTRREKVVEQEILYVRIKHALDQLDRISKAEIASAKAAKNLTASFASGLATELEVLAANDAVFDLRRTKARLSADIRIAWTELSVIDGSDLPAANGENP